MKNQMLFIIYLRFLKRCDCTVKVGLCVCVYETMNRQVCSEVYNVVFSGACKIILRQSHTCEIYKCIKMGI